MYKHPDFILGQRNTHRSYIEMPHRHKPTIYTHPSHTLAKSRLCRENQTAVPPVSQPEIIIWHRPLIRYAPPITYFLYWHIVYNDDIVYTRARYDRLLWISMSWERRRSASPIFFILFFYIKNPPKSKKAMARALSISRVSYQGIHSYEILNNQANHYGNNASLVSEDNRPPRTVRRDPRLFPGLMGSDSEIYM